jgi:uncharacterized membrane protein YjfL (UPF0719 family)
MFADLAVEMGTGLAYGLVGIVLLAVGYAVIDLLTPGNLRDLVYEHRNANAALVVASGLVAIATITTTAILASEDALVLGLVSAFGYGLVGVALLTVSFLVVDALTPGRLGAIIVDERPHPAVWVTAATHIGVGAIVAAAIS